MGDEGDFLALVFPSLLDLTPREERTMKPKTMILLVVAVGCGLVASYLTSKVLADRGTGEQQVETAKVVAAKRNLPLGTVISNPEKYFEEKEIPKNVAPKKGYASLDDIKNLRLTKPLSEDAFITKDDVLESSQDVFTQGIPPGHVAVGIKVTPENIVGGFVQPNVKVDVVTTLKRDNQESSSQVILQNILVLATDQEDSRDPAVKAKVSTTVTLAVTTEEALKLSLARSLGEVSLVLRKMGEESINPIRVVKIQDIFKPTKAQNGDDDDGKEAKAPKTVVKVEEKPEVKEPPVEYWFQEIRNGESVVRIKRRVDGKDLEDGSAITKSDPTTPRPTKKIVEQPKPGFKPETVAPKSSEK